MNELARVVDELTAAIWKLAQLGFVIETESPTYVLGVDRPKDLERLVVRAFTAALTPEQRAQVNNKTEIRIRVLKDAAEQLALIAAREGRTTDLGPDGPPPQVPSLTEALTDPKVLARTKDDDVVGFGTRQALAAAIGIRDEVLIRFDKTRQDIARRLWQEGLDAKVLALQIGKGIAFVRATERSIRFALRRALHAHASNIKAEAEAEAVNDRTEDHVEDLKDDAWIDLLLSDETKPEDIPPVTRHRIRHEVLKRTFQTERPAFGRRAPWALGIAAVATTLWLLVFTHKIPGPADDRAPPPSVNAACYEQRSLPATEQEPSFNPTRNVACQPGSALTLSVRAPKHARFVAFGSASSIILADEAGGSIALPFGARDAVQPIPYPGTIPADAVSGPLVIEAIFSRTELSPHQIEAALTRRALADSVVMTASTTLTLGEAPPTVDIPLAPGHPRRSDQK
ncbi:MAG: hypothetical protein H6729_00880 [Deltaproteobacteria bacterium]|nr:hypothetical protein [Deltaproteobacteria bacterium]